MSTNYYIPTPVIDALSETTNLYKIIYDAANPREQIKKYLENCFLKSKIDLPHFVANLLKTTIDFTKSVKGPFLRY